MALVNSTLNPDAPLFIPAAVRQVEDFSPEWWQLVTHSTWYRNYWLSIHPNGFDESPDEDINGDDIMDLLPDTFDLDAGEDLTAMEAQYEEFLRLSEVDEGKASSFAFNGDARKAGETKQSIIVKSLDVEGLGRRVMDPAKYVEKPAKNLNFKQSPRCIQQPR
ncbi:hypothetical protein MLD38_007594 [Melastoma candidum]|uniref:Uncharacterized protein n=1 Tax=Melastoma candidum TaxID=119954 RepID=A0ACB9RVC6_9MYRT|nr:hypothetical protein MLD38_007594 [Melastoma candidum]